MNAVAGQAIDHRRHFESPQRFAHATPQFSNPAETRPQRNAIGVRKGIQVGHRNCLRTAFAEDRKLETRSIRRLGRQRQRANGVALDRDLRQRIGCASSFIGWGGKTNQLKINARPFRRGRGRGQRDLHNARLVGGNHQRLGQYHIEQRTGLGAKGQLGGAQHHRQLARARRNDGLLHQMIGEQGQAGDTKFALEERCLV